MLTSACLARAYFMNNSLYTFPEYSSPAKSATGLKLGVTIYQYTAFVTLAFRLHWSHDRTLAHTNSLLRRFTIVWLHPATKFILTPAAQMGMQEVIEHIRSPPGIQTRICSRLRRRSYGPANFRIKKHTMRNTYEVQLLILCSLIDHSGNRSLKEQVCYSMKIIPHPRYCT